jgi:hypothetical protein
VGSNPTGATERKVKMEYYYIDKFDERHMFDNKENALRAARRYALKESLIINVYKTNEYGERITGKVIAYATKSGLLYAMT